MLDKKKRKEDLQKLLLECKSYDEFLRKAFSYLQKENKIFNYSELARRGGFPSRSYVRQLILGQKHITWHSLEGICQAFDLTGLSKKYFIVLWEISNIKNKEKKIKYHSKLAGLTKQIQGKKTQIDTSMYELEDWPLIYASLGSEQEGASLVNIQQRSKLDLKQCVLILKLLEEKGVARQVNSHYFPISNHIALNELGGDQFFKKYFIKKLEALKKRAEKYFTSEQDLFFQSTTCIPLKKIKQFRQDLRELLLEYIDTIESADGDTTVSLLVSMYEN
ncbi:MAG: hypothetical protein A2381_10165 [Bdellovibrionales bacterium RIFOXYB1_FULL_37_110]|nr:MAG: hypothetical protein A2417_02680 [Bdellovibrionales bacterium RIFOXYC1_FULL_37_79]OFZ61129.1 MAG: hypothetical protein A2381_10165 [Bdellovibrionales bacterium RIFOXYB1_FULL_37_110]OFZ65581.1 MAG: hypothetical protein A2577_02350 [Bdellovibrionales bacterium RIFOXYD1_FULL_36_51]